MTHISQKCKNVHKRTNPEQMMFMSFNEVLRHQKGVIRSPKSTEWQCNNNAMTEKRGQIDCTEN
jgi:hypothetical protein